ncbi:MAG: DUF3488 and transglutaminase-like domain-containing protein [Pseudomonadota bacterium]
MPGSPGPLWGGTLNPLLLQRFWLVVPLGLVLLPHAWHLPAWISLAWLGFAGLSLRGAARRQPPLNHWLKWLATLGGVGGVLLGYGSVLGPGGGVALLAFLSGAKLLELDTTRDRAGLLFVTLFLLVAHFLEDQALFTAGWMALAGTVLVAAFVALETPPGQLAARSRPNLILAGQLMLQALPLALLLFVLFPRIQGPLWGLPQQKTAASGLAEQMSPGDISRLILSDELAFRAEFPAAQPQSRDLYWRGPVLWDFDGRGWYRARPVEPASPQGQGLGEPLTYTITLEPHHQRWLFLLGYPARLPDQPVSSLGPDLQWQARDPVHQRLRYQVSSHPAYRLDPVLEATHRTRALALPPGGNRRARELALDLAVAGGGDAAIVERALSHFRQEKFFYTLSPPPLGESAVDEFLFDTRRGFCEHYAGAFVFLMRAAGVPARVVTGYQGGEFNPYGRHWIVRGRDAHAWAEVWLPQLGWTRVDPTAAVAPERVEQGVNAALPAGERLDIPLPVAGDWLRALDLGWDLVNSRWNQWVLGYNHDRQRRFLASLAPFLATLQGMVGLLTALLALGLLVLAALLFQRRRPALDPAARAYARFCARLARLGLPRGGAEGPADYARRAAAARPDLAEPIATVTRLYLAARYGAAEPAQVEALTAAVQRFRPGGPPQP